MSDPVRHVQHNIQDAGARERSGQTTSGVLSMGMRKHEDALDVPPPCSDISLHAGTQSEASPPDRGLDQAALARLIEGDVIPKLMLAYQREAPAREARGRAARITPRMAESVAGFALRGEGAKLDAYLEARLAAGVTLGELMQSVLAPAARLLGKYWDEDLCSFTDVTLGLGILQRALSTLTRHSGFAHAQDVACVHLATLPGAAHSFGLAMVEASFRQAGWRTASSLSQPASAILSALQKDWFDVFALSISCQDDLDKAAVIIKDARQASKNRAMKVLTGGLVYGERPDLRLALGEDMNATNGSEAVALAQTSLGMIEGRL